MPLGPTHNRQGKQPQPDWLSIGKGVFHFGIGNASAASRPPNADEAQAVSVAAPQLEELQQILKEVAGAYSAEIDREAGRFSFCFVLWDGTATCLGGPPWAILEEDVVADDLPPHVQAEALFNKQGLVRVDDETAARDAKLYERVRHATALVWRQRMLPAFDRAVSDNRAILHARVGKARSRVEQLPADLWPLLSVVDWDSGIAKDPDDVSYYTLSVRSATPSLVFTIADETKAAAALAIRFRLNPDLERAVAMRFCKEAGYKLSARGFQQRVWPNARRLAGLPALGTPGIKPGSRRKS